MAYQHDFLLNLDRLAKTLFIGFLYCKLLLFSFSILYVFLEQSPYEHLKT